MSDQRLRYDRSRKWLQHWIQRDGTGDMGSAQGMVPATDVAFLASDPKYWQGDVQWKNSST